MTTSQATPFLAEIASDAAIPLNKLAYFRARTRNRLYDLIIDRFLERQKLGFTKADLARRIGKKPEVITRLLGAPGNWTIDTVSDLLLGIVAEELDPQSLSVLNRAPRNLTAHDLLILGLPKSEPKTEEKAPAQLSVVSGAVSGAPAIAATAESTKTPTLIRRFG